MVVENATVFPSPEGHERECPPPFSTYGFQKLACEYFAQNGFPMEDGPSVEIAAEANGIDIRYYNLIYNLVDDVKAAEAQRAIARTVLAAGAAERCVFASEDDAALESFRRLRAHLMTLSSHKIYGPKGAGALVADAGVALEPLLHGGGQERDVRSGTLDVPRRQDIGDQRCEDGEHTAS